MRRACFGERRSVAIRAVIALGVFGILTAGLIPPAKSDVFKWLDRQVDGAPGEDGVLIDELEPGPWRMSILERESKATPQRNVSSTAFGKDEDGYSGVKEPKQEETGAAYKPQDVNLLTDGMTHFRLARPGVVPEARIEAKLNQIAARVLAVQPVTNVPIRFVVTGARGLGDASAMHDGVIGIPIAIIADVGSEDELAFVVAHEISHVLLNHHNAEWLASTNEKLANVAEVGLASAVELGAAYGFLDANNQAEMQKVQLITWFAAQATLFLTETALTPSWSRDQEIEADLLAFDLVARAGYDVYEAPVFLERLLKYFEGVETDPFAARRADLDARAESTRDIGQAFMNFVEKARLEFDALTTDLEERHPETQERLDSLVDYIDEHYEDKEDEFDEREAIRSGWAKFLAQPSVDELLTIYRASWETRNYIDVEDYKGAQQKAFAAIKGRGGSLALPRLNFALLRKLQGETTKQRLNLEYALKGPEPSFEVYRDTIRLYRDSGKIKAADALIDEAWTRFKEPPGLYPFRIDALLRSNQREAAQELTTTCRLVFRDKAKSCVQASQGKLKEWEAEQQASL